MPHPPKLSGEHELIRRLSGWLDAPADAPAHPFGDDLASLAPGVLWSCDMLLDGVHFERARHDPVRIGRKAIGVNLSDCAASGCRPLGALCAIALGRDTDVDLAEQILRGIDEAGREHGCPLRGGDTNGWAGGLVVSVSVAACPFGPAAIARDGARNGDRLYLSGPVGGSLLGRHLEPVPRLALAERLACDFHPTAMIDVSDGLAIDLWRICEASGCAAWLDEQALESAVHPDARRRAAVTGTAPRDHALFDGEDFELLIAHPALPAADRDRLGLLELGGFTEGPPQVGLRTAAGEQPVPRRGWEHLS